MSHTRYQVSWAVDVGFPVSFFPFDFDLDAALAAVPVYMVVLPLRSCFSSSGSSWSDPRSESPWPGTYSWLTRYILVKVTLKATSAAFASFLNFFLSSSLISLTLTILFKGTDAFGLSVPSFAEGHSCEFSIRFNIYILLTIKVFWDIAVVWYRMLVHLYKSQMIRPSFIT